MASTTPSRELVNIIAEEAALGVATAVECWMAEIEQALADPHLTTLGRLNAVNEILNNYKRLTGKARLHCRRA